MHMVPTNIKYFGYRFDKKIVLVLANIYFIFFAFGPCCFGLVLAKLIYIGFGPCNM
jgi:hypothetical protein